MLLSVLLVPFCCTCQIPFDNSHILKTLVLAYYVVRLALFKHINILIALTIAVCSGLTAFATYLLTKEIWTPGAGLFAACFIAIGLSNILLTSWFKLTYIQLSISSMCGCAHCQSATCGPSLEL